MSYYPDLSPCSEVLQRPNERCLAIGWLEPTHEFPRGEVSQEFFERLCKLLVDPWSFVAVAGRHPCSFCRFTGGGQATFNGLRISPSGSGFLFVPSGNTLYASPTSIAHYIDAHGYCPPKEFQIAVMECPEMRSVAYMRALLSTPAREWIKKNSDGQG